ncbi:hypothetical protein [Lujinxingia vulgaris]|uniref:hypothetical protein n=1 Tax=Lujinxingia vulgaris TaxID=2600176 RepID=UPI001E2B58DD|nr:hypothetical protein [Lujinxingia vulgaris]
MARSYTCSVSLKPFDHARALSRLEALFHARNEHPHAPLSELRAALFDAGATASQLERTLIALATHPDPHADALLDHPALTFTCQRRAFALTIARKLRARRRSLLQKSSDASPHTGRRAA